MKINLIGPYDHFPNHKALPFEACVDMYNDAYVYQATEGSCALLIEPRSIQPEVYKWMEQNYKRFRYVFTHDSKLLNMCDNAKLILWGSGSGGISQYPIVEKTKNISFVSSDKTMCELHKARLNLAMVLKDSPYIDVMGTFDGGPRVSAQQIYQDYRFSIAFENYIDDYWFTEKICNCFANKVIPIYFGARKIDEFFNMDGVIRVEDWRDLVVTYNTKIYPSNYEKYYENCKDAIEDNYRRVQKYATFENWFFRKYEDLLNEC